MRKSIESPDKNKWYDLELREDRYVRIPKNFINKIHLDNERNIVLKSNDNVWFFEIRDENEEKKIVERILVNVDKKWGFIVPLMYFQLNNKPRIQQFIFFDDENGIGCGQSGAYFIWANGKLNKENIASLGLQTREDVDEYIKKILKKNREEYGNKNIH